MTAHAGAPSARPPLGDTARRAGLAVALFGAAQIAAAVLAQNASGSAAVQAVIAEFGCARLGVAWSDPLAPMPTARAIAARALRGAAFGALAAGAIAAVAALARGARVSFSTAAAAQIVVGLLIACVAAVRDELILRGAVLRAFSQAVPLPAALAICGVAGAAAHYGTNGGGTAELAAAGLGAVALAALWVRDRGAWLAWGANAAFRFVTGPLLHGGLFDVRAENAWGGGDGGVDTGFAAVIVLGAAAIGAGSWALRTPQNSRTGDRVG